MARFTLIWASVLSISVVAFGQQEQEKGAKAIFLDTQTGRMAMPVVPRPAPKSGSAAVEVPAITGLMFYFELLQPNGELIRVNSSRVFRSGEKVRLHVTTNIDGRLTILQSQEKGKFEELFPSPKLPESSAFVRSGVETILPTPGSWFKFDEQTGEIRLLMMLTAGAPKTPASVASYPPIKKDVSTTTLPGSVDERSEAMMAFEKLQRGSKALLIETDDSPRDAAEVRVVNSAKDHELPPGRIVVELKLQHRRRD